MRNCFLLVALCGCSPSWVDKVHDPDVPNFRIEVDAVAGSGPYIGAIGPIETPWSLMLTNITAILPAQKTVLVPEDQDAVFTFPSPGQAFMTRDEILSLAEEVRQYPETTEESVLQAIWLDAQFADETGPRPEVIGVSFTGTSVIAMFKPTVETLGARDLTLSFAEQSTFIHEVGHAIGLVNNGVAMQTEHQDDEHGAHCSNDRCVMYYMNKGVVDLVTFVQDVIQDSTTVIFDEDCLSDLRAAQ